MALKRGDAASTQARRLEIIQTAFESFAINGFAATSLKSIAHKMGMTEAGILHHYPTKVNLFEAVLDFREEVSIEIVNIRSKKGIDFFVGWLLLIDHNTSHPEKVRFFTVMCSESIHADHPAHEYFRNRYKQIEKEFVRQLKYCQRNNHLKVGLNCTTLSRTIIAAADGIQLQWLRDENIDMVAITFELLKNYFVEDAAAEIWLKYKSHKSSR